MPRLTGSERTIVVTALRHAVPYVRMYKRKVFVLKAGGDAFATPESTRALMEQIGILHQVGIRVVLVHGGGPQATKLSERLGLEATHNPNRWILPVTPGISTGGVCRRSGAAAAIHAIAAPRSKSCARN